MDKHGQEGPVWFLVVLIIAILFLLVVGWVFLGKIRSGGEEVGACQGQCMDVCGDGYEHFLPGDYNCATKKNSEGNLCCNPLVLPEGTYIRSGDVALYYNNDRSKPVSMGGSVDWINRDGTFVSEFDLSLRNAGATTRCYGQIQEGKLRAATFSLAALIKQSSLDKALKGENGPIDPAVTKVGAIKGKEYACTSINGETMKLEPDDYQKLLATGPKQVKYSIYSIDTECGNEKTLTECNPQTVTWWWLEAPEPKPKITLLVNGAPIADGSTTALEPGKSYAFDAMIEETLGACTFNRTPANLPPKFVEALDNGKSFTNDCVYFSDARSTISLDVPGDAARGTLFTLTYTTEGRLERRAQRVMASYTFVVAPDPYLTVEGMVPHLTKEKRLTITCDGIACKAFNFYAVEETTDCHPGVASGEQLTIEPTFTASNRATLTLTDERLNREYLCVEAETLEQGSSNTRRYSLAYWQKGNLIPVPIALDTTRPEIVASYDPLQGELTMSCFDIASQAAGEHGMSGCASKPFSYAYVTDPALFVTDIILATATLNEKFVGCPDPATGRWIAYNLGNPAEVPFIAHDVRVICIRAMDNAGNTAVKGKLVYSAQEVLGALLAETAN